MGKYINLPRCRQVIETESAEKRTGDNQTCLSEDQKHTSNVAKDHYQKLRKNLAAVNKATHENVNQERKGYDRKKQLFQIARIISNAKGFLNMVMIVGPLYEMIPALNFTHHVGRAH